MEKKKQTLTAAFFTFFLFKSIAGDDDCLPASCSPTGPQVRFPFRLPGRQPSKCGFPGFDLSCNKQNQTLIKLPSSRSYVVRQIYYALQIINIDPDFCRSEPIIDLNLTDTPFDYSSVQSYTFYNCSRSLGWKYQSVPTVPFPCLGRVNQSVFAVRTGWLSSELTPASCKKIATISVPARPYSDIRDELTLMWFRPFCGSCERDGRTCGLKSDDEETACFGSSSHGIPRSAKYGLSIGIGVPALVCLIGLVCYTVGKVRDYNHTHHHQSIDLFSIAITPQPPSTTGLDGPTIESYPKIVLGESCRLPKDDSTCPICLSDYEPKEEVRTIPECNHYFHVDCIDEWLKLNVTCPVCRNTPESSSLVTPCSSMSSNSSRATNQ